MRPLTLSLIAAGSVLALVACHPVEGHHHHAMWDGNNHWNWDKHDDDRVVTVGATVDCPESEGDLTRTAQAADGKSCQYHGDDDQDVTLTLLPLNGQAPDVALKPMEMELAALAPAPSGNSAVNIDTHSGAGADKAKIDMPGFHIDADGDKAKIRILGTTIDADGDRADIKSNMGGMKNAVIHAGPGGAQIRAGDVGKNSADLVYILAGDTAGPSGYRAVGYIARGPVAGPLVVGEFKSRAEHHGDRPDHDLQRLIDLNVR